MSAQYREEYGAAVYLHEGVAYTPNVTPAFLEGIENFPMEDGDVIVAGHPKSGTNWMDITLAHLFDHWETCKITPNRVVPELSVPDDLDSDFQGFNKCIAAPSPRLMKTHLPYNLLPRAFREDHVGKAIYVTRNPKDVCDSYFHNLKTVVNGDWTWEQHYEAFLRGTLFFGPWLDNVISWYENGGDRVLRLKYEEMHIDKRGTLERIIDFVGVPVASERLDQIIRDTDFEAMKKSGMDKQYQPSMTRRQGKAGGWKTRFTVEQSERFDRELDAPLRARGINMIYEV